MHISMDVAAAQQKSFEDRRRIRREQQTHLRLLRCAIGFAAVASPACGHHIAPVIRAPVGNRHGVFPRQASIIEMAAAVGTRHVIPPKQLGVGQAGHRVKQIDPGGAGGRDDGVHIDPRLQAGDGIGAAAQGRAHATNGPAEPGGGIVNRGLLGRDPLLGYSPDVELQNLHGKGPLVAVVDGGSVINNLVPCLLGLTCRDRTDDRGDHNPELCH